ncbi:MAG: RNA polymerase factor sigma-54 [Cardiobacteriaceae bacterium]|nr:RNA polymerase factor sigma-54 [Cardiobacteriaceae bacterium]
MQNQNLDLSLKQTLTLTPQLQQAIKLLNMNNIDLQIEIAGMLAQNIMLERKSEFSYENSTSSEDEQGNDGGDNEGLLETLTDQLEYDSTWEEHYDHDWKDHQPYQEEASNLELYISAQPELSSYLEEQVNHMPISDEKRQAALIIVFELDEDGYFRNDIKKLAEQHHVSIAQMEEGLRLVQQCQPSGIGARNLEECLLLQISSLPKDTPYLEELQQIMRRYFGFITKKPLMIRQRLGMSDATYDHAIALLRSLDPRPGQNFSHEPPQYVQPEIIVREKNGISYIETTDSIRPDIAINQAYAKLAEVSKGADKTLLQAQMQEARWFLSAIDKRADTIRRVASVIVALQQDFFQEGDAAMRPLTRQKVAELLDIHESTVSRAVNGKYLMCKRGIFELRYFFSAQLENSEGDEQSTIAIKALIAGLIDKEDPSKPLSDQKITDLLNEQGHKIARRTVTKYRELMDIPITTLRRKR